MEKLAIIGASYLQLPLIRKAKTMGYETHVFAWAANDVGEKEADYFYPISITEKEEILEKCREIGISGICSIASDLAMVAVNYVADKLGLTGNSPEVTLRSTNKYEMRKAFFENGVPSPKSVQACDIGEDGPDMEYPLIVKPVDRSGSRGVSKVTREEDLEPAIEAAMSESFDKNVVVEEFVEGDEYSVECVSWQGEHQFITVTKKFTNGSPHYIESGHLQPAPLSDEVLGEVKDVTFQALDGLGIKNGASHTELKITEDGRIVIIEVGGRMGGGNIGSSLVELSTGFDFVAAVIDIAVGKKPELVVKDTGVYAAVKYVLSTSDLDILKEVKEKDPSCIIEENIFAEVPKKAIVDSSQRSGYFIMTSRSKEEMLGYLQGGE